MQVRPHAVSVARLRAGLAEVLPPSRLIEDELRRLAYGTDASFYRLIPKLVVVVENEDEVAAVHRLAGECGVPLTIRAAGTSLSGQAVTDSVLVKISRRWSRHWIGPAGRWIRLEPAVIGGVANQYLTPYGRKIGPDPASLDAAMIGGIAANNASGMCCGRAQNAYQTLLSVRVVLADGTRLDTGDAESRAVFARTHGVLLERLRDLGQRARGDEALASRIRHKYRLKNTIGYSLNALVDFEDPFEILQHLLIGSEGTLGFLSEVTLRTVADPKEKATSLVLFESPDEACAAVSRLGQGVASAVEFMDRRAIRSVENLPELPSPARDLGGDGAAILIELSGETRDELAERVEMAQRALDPASTTGPVSFTRDDAARGGLWKLRKGLYPTVGAMREIGTTVVIEDVAFPLERLATAVRDLRRAFESHGYQDAVLFGHALEGNLHFVFSQDFSRPQEVERYQGLMEDVVRLVVDEHDGSLKAEHGTGRNMAPFVEREWGQAAYELMREIKAIFDPAGVLGPGVVLNDDADVFVKDLKPLPPADPIVDSCIECGFCEPVCPSRGLTLTPRERIVVVREMARLERTGESGQRLAQLRADFEHQGLDTCAADGMCETRCPVAIDTGRYVKQERTKGRSGQRTAAWIASHMALATRVARGVLRSADLAHMMLGKERMGRAASAIRRWSNGRIPEWGSAVPRPAPPIPVGGLPGWGNPVIYFPSCVTRCFGATRGDPVSESVPEATADLLRRAGYDVWYPEELSSLCCGMAFESKGFPEIADQKAVEIESAIRTIPGGAAIPVYCDTSPCAHRLRKTLEGRLRVYDSIEFLDRFVMDRLAVDPLEETITVHVPCSAARAGLGEALLRIARACAREVIPLHRIACCGFAGDKGFQLPELTASALRELAGELGPDCSSGYSASRACEIGLTQHSNRPFRSIVHLANRATRGS